MHLAEQTVQRLGRVFVEVARRFVREEQGRAHDEGAGHGDTLLLAAGQHAWPVRHPLTETHALAATPWRAAASRPERGARCASASRRFRSR